MLLQFCKWLYNLSFSTAIRESTWIFPALECIHIYSMIFLISILAAFDLRLMGFGLGWQRQQPLAKFSRTVLHWAWVCFGVNFITGSLIFSSESTKMYGNAAFQIKMLLVLVALVYHTIVLRRAERWEKGPLLPVTAKVVGSFSLLLWVAIIAASRWIAFMPQIPMQ